MYPTRKKIGHFNKKYGISDKEGISAKGHFRKNIAFQQK